MTRTQELLNEALAATRQEGGDNRVYNLLIDAYEDNDLSENGDRYEFEKAYESVQEAWALVEQDEGLSVPVGKVLTHLNFVVNDRGWSER